MKILKLKNLNIQNQKLMSKPIIACWGFFDGIHQGHQALFKQLLVNSTINNYQTCIISFDRKPQSVISNKNNEVLLSNEDKIKTIAKYNFDYYWEIKFSKEIATLSPEQFISWLLANNVKAVVVNPNIRFGYQGQGNIKTLQQSSLQVYLCNDIIVNNNKVSSTYIKQLLQNKDISSANLCLQQEPYTISGKVVHGIKEARTINFPTANLSLLTNYALPGLATYITLTEVDNKCYQSMTVIMLRNNKPLVETYLLNFNQDLYGKIIKLRFLDFLRDNLKFTNLDDLKKQVDKDLIETIKYFANSSSKLLKP